MPLISLNPLHTSFGSTERKEEDWGPKNWVMTDAALCLGRKRERAREGERERARERNGNDVK